MSTAKIAKNGMINLPVKIREKLGVVPGDQISFIETEQGIVIVPLRDVLDLIDPDNMAKTRELVQELHKERREEEW